MQATDKRRILFLCTGNSCRSQMAEALLRQLGGDRFESFSAGSQPAGFVHGLAEYAMEVMGVPMEAPRSKSWDEFQDTPVDAVITLCDSAAAETCPVWPGSPLTAHWGMPDPALHPGTDQQRMDFAVTVAHRLHDKIRALIDLDWSAERSALQQQLNRLGEI